jgi:hypothetical protein
MRVSVVRPHLRRIANSRQAAHAVQLAQRLIHLLFHFHQRGPKLRRFRHKFTRDADALGLGNFRKSRAVLVSEPLKEALPSGLVARHAVIDSTIPRIVEGIWTR